MSNQRFRVNTPTVTHETIDGEAVIINLDSGNYYSLIEVGSFIGVWLKKELPRMRFRICFSKPIRATPRILIEAYRSYWPNCCRRT
jgi:hypothetical protein